MLRVLSLLAQCAAPLWLTLVAFGAQAESGVPVVVSAARAQPVFRQIDVTGSVTSPAAARLSPAIAGLVEALHVEAGDTVEAGDLLLELDAELARWQWQSAESVRRQATTALADAERRLREAQQLAPQRSIAKTVVQDLEAEVAQDKAATDRATADASYQRAVLDRHQLRAPFAGVISSRQAERGEWVTPGQGVYELVSTTGLRLDFAVPEDFLALLTPAAPVRFTLNATPGVSYDGRVQAIVPVSDPGARTFLLRVLPENAAVPMMPGMSVRARLQIPIAANGIVVPRDALLRYPDGRTVVWVVERNGEAALARERVVEAGETFDGMVEIRQGLAAGAELVVRGNEALRDGQSLRISGER